MLVCGWKSNNGPMPILMVSTEQLKQGLQGIVMAPLTRSLNWTPSQVEVFLVNVRKELDDMSYHILDHA